MTYQEIIKYFKTLANKDIAEYTQRFVKTAKGEYGYGDKFLGIRVPVIRQEIKKYQNISLDTTEKLLRCEFHEVRLFALLLMIFKFNKNENQKEIYELYLKNTKYINCWDLVDSSASHIVGKYLIDKDRDRDILYKLANSESLWQRRIAIIATFYFIRNNQFTDTLKISKILLKDKEDLIHKAVGWMLREVSKRGFKLATTFLKDNYQNVHRMTLRYAIERFPTVQRQKYLKGKF